MTKSKKEVLETKRKPTYNKVGIVSLISATLKQTGFETGKLYTWDRAGAVVQVDERDVPALLQKTLGDKSCCGGSPNKMFQKLD